jgi:hypothetical protein
MSSGKCYIITALKPRVIDRIRTVQGDRYATAMEWLYKTLLIGTLGAGMDFAKRDAGMDGFDDANCNIGCEGDKKASRGAADARPSFNRRQTNSASTPPCWSRCWSISPTEEPHTSPSARAFRPIKLCGSPQPPNNRALSTRQLYPSSSRSQSPPRECRDMLNSNEPSDALAEIKGIQVEMEREYGRLYPSRISTVRSGNDCY